MGFVDVSGMWFGWNVCIGAKSAPVILSSANSCGVRTSTKMMLSLAKASATSAGVQCSRMPCSVFSISMRSLLESIKRNFQIAVAIFFGLRRTTGPQVHLQHVQHPVRQGERFVPRLAPVDISRLGRPAADVHVVTPLFGHGGFPRGAGAVRGAVVVSDEEPCFAGQGKDILQRIPQVVGGPAGEVGA